MKIIRGRERKTIEAEDFAEFEAAGWVALKPETPAFSNSQKEIKWQLQREVPVSSKPEVKQSEKSKATPSTPQPTPSTQPN